MEVHRCPSRRHAASRSVAEGTRVEQAAFEECRLSPQRAALTHLFKAEREARRIPDIGDAKPMPIRKAAILGSGTMGGGIAMCFANAGIPVAMIDISDDAVRKGMSVIEKSYATSVERGSTTPEAMRGAALALIKPTTDYGAVSDVDIVIEAIVENMALKKEAFAKLDKLAPRHAILTSNTSSLDIDEIASVTTRPEKVVGTHFFSPANVMKLLENVRGKKSSPETIATVMNMHKVIDKVVIVTGRQPAATASSAIACFRFYNTGWEYLMEEGATPELGSIALPVKLSALRWDLARYAIWPVLDVAVMVRAARYHRLYPRKNASHRSSPQHERLVAARAIWPKDRRWCLQVRRPQADLRSGDHKDRRTGSSRIRHQAPRKVADEEIMPRMLYPMSLMKVQRSWRKLDRASRQRHRCEVYCYAYGFPEARSAARCIGRSSRGSTRSSP